MTFSKSILTTLFVVMAALPIAGCAGLAGGGGAGGASILGDLGKFAPPILGDLGKFAPPGLGQNLALSDSPGRGLPYEVRPSNTVLVAPDAGKIYGSY